MPIRLLALMCALVLPSVAVAKDRPLPDGNYRVLQMYAEQLIDSSCAVAQFRANRAGGGAVPSICWSQAPAHDNVAVWRQQVDTEADCARQLSRLTMTGGIMSNECAYRAPRAPQSATWEMTEGARNALHEPSSPSVHCFGSINPGGSQDTDCY